MDKIKSIGAWIAITITGLLLISDATSAQVNSKVEKSTVNAWLQKYSALRFTENRGQMMDLQGKPVDNLLFRGNGSGVDVYITTSGLSYVFNKVKRKEIVSPDSPSRQVHAPNIKDEEFTTDYCRADMELLGAEIKKENIVKESESEDRSDYYLAHCPAGIKNVHSYEKITIKNIYPGIDWVLYASGQNKNTGGLEYDFIVHPGANPSLIKLRYNHTGDLSLQEDGSVKINTSMGTLEEGIPVSYQGENKQKCNTRYRLDKNEISFVVGDYNKSETLVIDPVLVWGTYYNSSTASYKFNDSNSIYSDGTNVWVTGQSVMSAFPTYTSGASAYMQTGTPTGTDAFILEFNTCGKLIWATYYSGTGMDYATSIHSDKQNVWVTGYTASTDLPTQSLAGAYNQPVFGGGAATNNAFILEFNCATNARVWATYYGGSQQDRAASINSDGTNVWVTGYTNSPDLPTKIFASAYNQSALGGSNTNAFILQFNCATSALVWGTYYGGSSVYGDYGYSINSDGTNVWVTGSAGAGSFPLQSMTGAYNQGSMGSAYNNAFILEFSCSNSAREWATFYGGNFSEAGSSVSSDGTNVWVAGVAQSSDMPTLNPGSGAYFQGSLGGSGAVNALIAEFSCVTGAMKWSTYYGGTGGWTGAFQGASCISSDGKNVWVSGMTSNSDWPTLKPVCDYYDSVNGGGNTAAFILQFNNLGARQWATYYGANHWINGQCYICSDGHNMFLTLSNASGSSTQPLQDPADGAYYNGDGSGTQTIYIGKFQLCPPFKAGPDTEVCAGSPVPLQVSGADSYSWSPATALSSTTIANPMATPTVTTTYTVTGTDNCTGATSTATVTINVNPISFNAPSVTNATCGNSDGVIVASASGGNGALTYSWSNIASGITDNNLVAATYVLTVTDSKGCSASQSASVSSTPGPTINSISSSSVMCKGSSTGTASVSASGTGTLTYTWSALGGSGNTSITGLAAGIYTVTVKDGNGCLGISSVTITEPSSSVSVISITPVNATCGANNGSATVTVNGGTGPDYTYSWSNAVSAVTSSFTSTDTSLSAQTYTLTVRDANNCSLTKTVSIGSVGGPDITSVSSSSVRCYGGKTGSATVSISTGIAPYTYSWSSGVENITSFLQASDTGRVAATYIVTVTDGNGCSATSTVAITQPAALLISAAQTTAPMCNDSNGVASVIAVSGGTGSFSYTWSNGTTGINASGLAPGIYTVTATDLNGCKQTATATLNNSPSPGIISTKVTDAKCNGSNSGSIQVNISGSTAPYSYSWSSASGAGSGSGSSLSYSADSLAAGTYTITVTDKNGCRVVSNATVTEPPPLIITKIATTIAACNSNDGTATVTVSGGSGSEFTYSWSNGLSNTTANTSSLAGNLGGGTYTISVNDPNGCMKTSTFFINSTNGPTTATAIATSINCNGQTGSVTATASSGTTPYTYSWSSSGGSASTANKLAAGTYTVTVTDKNGCTSTSTIALTQPAPLTVTAVGQPASCGGINGIATAVAGGGSTSYTYSWSASGGSDSVNLGLSAGTYSVTVTDSKGCTSISSVAISNSIPPVASVASTQTTITEGNSTVLIGGGGSIYSWTPSSSLSCTNCATPEAHPDATTTYTLYVKDGNGCIDSTFITIDVKKACSNGEDIFIANIFSPNGDGQNDVLNIEGNAVTNIYWSIYDRWGNEVFETTDQSHGWDGSKNGSSLESGTYVYYLKAICMKTNAEVKLKGNVSVVK